MVTLHDRTIVPIVWASHPSQTIGTIALQSFPNDWDNRSTMRNHLNIRRAFTLVELVVVIAIIAVLIGLLLPATQAARESARRVQCQNQVKQIVLGLQTYHDAVRFLPPAYPGAFDPTVDGKRWGWATFILPFIEQQALYEKLEPSRDSLFQVAYDPVKRLLLQNSVSTYLCASDPSDLLADNNRDYSGPPGSSPAGSGPASARLATHINHIGYRPATSNYVCNFGSFWRPNYGLWSATELRGNGVMGCSTRVRIADIFDGSSVTFAIGERTYRNHASTWTGVEAWDSCTSQGVSMVAGTAYYKLNAPASSYPYTCDGVGASGFSSSHPGGANFGMCDGSVRFVSASIESLNSDELGKSGKLGLYQRLAAANDHLLITDF